MENQTRPISASKMCECRSFPDGGAFFSIWRGICYHRLVTALLENASSLTTSTDPAVTVRAVPNSEVATPMAASVR